MEISYEHNKWLQSQWRKNTRLYTLTLCQNLSGAWIITSTWGSALTRGFGKSLDVFCSDYESGVEIYNRLQQRREKRGYQRVG
jgi:hypothetical protein